MTNLVKGYKLNLQQVMSSKVPNSVLQFMMKHTYFRKVRESESASRSESVTRLASYSSRRPRA